MNFVLIYNTKVEKKHGLRVESGHTSCYKLLISFYDRTSGEVVLLVWGNFLHGGKLLSAQGTFSERWSYLLSCGMQSVCPS